MAANYGLAAICAVSSAYTAYAFYDANVTASSRAKGDMTVRVWEKPHRSWRGSVRTEPLAGQPRFHWERSWNSDDFAKFTVDMGRLGEFEFHLPWKK